MVLTFFHVNILVPNILFCLFYFFKKPPAASETSNSTTTDDDDVNKEVSVEIQGNKKKMSNFTARLSRKQCIFIEL